MDYIQIKKERLSFLEEFLIKNVNSQVTLDYYFTTFGLNKKEIFKVKASCMEGWLKALTDEIKDLKKQLKKIKIEASYSEYKSVHAAKFSKTQKLLSQKQKQCRTISVLHCVYWNGDNLAEKTVSKKFNYVEAKMFVQLFNLMDDKRIKSFLGLNKNLGGELITP